LATPYLQNMNRGRVKLIKTALPDVALIKQEGAIRMMPEVRLGRKVK
jgi:hypothetical protein